MFLHLFAEKMGKPKMSYKSLALAFAATVTLATTAAVSAQHEGHSVVVEVQTPSVEVVGPAIEVAAPPVHVTAPPVHVVAAPVKPAAVCHPIAIVRELSLPSAKHAYRCHGAPVHQVLCVDNPADHCHKLFNVPVCVPACCVDHPVCVSTNVGLLGRGYATYRWQCGFEVTVTFLVRGGAILTYR